MEGSLKETPYEKRIRRLMTGEDGGSIWVLY